METNKSRLLPLMKKNNLMELFPKILNVEKEYFRVMNIEYGLLFPCSLS